MNHHNYLLNDIKSLVSETLVIRCDLTTKTQSSRQLLPRTDDILTQESALDWLKKSSLTLLQDTKSKDKIAFIFHNFIPSISSAFAYAAPNER